MANIQSPPADSTGVNDVNCAGLTTLPGRTVFIINMEFPASFGATQESVIWTYSFG